MLGRMMRLTAIFVALLLLAATAPAWAKEDKATPSPPGQSEAHSPPRGGEPNGHAPSGQDHTPPGQEKNKQTPPGQDKADGDVPPGQQHHPQAEQDEAQAAVESNDALPLARIVEIAQVSKAGRVIDAKLVRIDGFLLYELTMLDDDGRSWRDYYYARTGNPVTIP